jgi:hypothetical protein
MPLTPQEYIRELINRLGAKFIAKILRNSKEVKEKMEKK